jgi:splicing factor 3A subunit 3
MILQVRDEINSDHRVSELLQRNADVCQKLSALYEDGDGLRQEEVDALSGTDEFGEFYRKLRNLKDYHRSASSNVEEPLQMEFLKLDEARNTASEESHNLVDFTDEEGYGKYLDLHSVYSEYLNLKQFEVSRNMPIGTYMCVCHSVLSYISLMMYICCVPLVSLLVLSCLCIC